MKLEAWKDTLDKQAFIPPRLEKQIEEDARQALYDFTDINPVLSDEAMRSYFDDTLKYNIEEMVYEWTGREATMEELALAKKIFEEQFEKEDAYKKENN